MQGCPSRRLPSSARMLAMCRGCCCQAETEEPFYPSEMDLARFQARRQDRPFGAKSWTGTTDSTEDLGSDGASSSVPSRRKHNQMRLEERQRFEVEPGMFYEGQWMGEVRQGQGFMNRIGVGTYEGQFIRNRATGHGLFIKSNRDIYEGEWLNDRAHGRGTYTHADGGTYVGEWSEDLKNGSGVEVWVDGSKYEGSYSQGKKHGHGTYLGSDDSTFEGQWYMDAMDGEGQYAFADSRIYIGQWQENRMHGEGRMVWPDGRRYEGQYEDDRKSGFGKFTWSDGRSYSGQWYRGRQHGRGTYTDPKGRKWTGDWNQGQKVSPKQHGSLEDGGGMDLTSSPRRGSRNMLGGVASAVGSYSGMSNASNVSTFSAPHSDNTDYSSSPSNARSRHAIAAPQPSRVGGPGGIDMEDGSVRGIFRCDSRDDNSYGQPSECGSKEPLRGRRYK